MNETSEPRSGGPPRLDCGLGDDALNPVSFLQNARAGALRIATLALGAASLSACAYGYGDYGGYGGVSVGVGSGYAGGFDPYCDGYAAWDSWYGCDYGYGFGQIGFGGGYWDNFYYPGYGTWIYDRPGGRRFAMQDRHRRYWGQQRWQYYQQRRADRRDFAMTGGTIGAIGVVIDARRSTTGAIGDASARPTGRNSPAPGAENASAWAV